MAEAVKIKTKKRGKNKAKQTADPGVNQLTKDVLSEAPTSSPDIRESDADQQTSKPEDGEQNVSLLADEVHDILESDPGADVDGSTSILPPEPRETNACDGNLHEHLDSGGTTVVFDSKKDCTILDDIKSDENIESEVDCDSTTDDKSSESFTLPRQLQKQNLLSRKTQSGSDEIVEALEITSSPNDRRPDKNQQLPEQNDIGSTLEVDLVIPSADHHNLYPKLHELTITGDTLGGNIQPFTDEQLKTLYYNQELEQIYSFVETFLTEINQGCNEFYEIVLSYYRARNNLASAEHDIQVLQTDYRRYKDLVWELKEKTVSVQGQCADKAKVTAELTYSTAIYNETSCDNVTHTLRDIRNHLHERLSLYGYEAQLSRLQVESYIHKLYTRNPALCDIPPNSPVQAVFPHVRDRKVTQQVEVLKKCTTVLFMFQRKPAKDDVFIKDCRLWLSRLVATLLRVATVEDHLYLVNQILRCPAGVGKWAAGFLQTVAPPCGGLQTWGDPLLDHYITSLAFILLPVEKREDVLYQMKVMLSPTPDKVLDNPWILVDSDGEADEDTAQTWHYFLENDLVAFLNQLPLDIAFKHVMCIETSDKGEILYDVNRTTENSLLRIFAFSTCLIRLLASGLENFSLSRYRQLNKRLGRMIKTVVQLVSDHWQNFERSHPDLHEPTWARLQLEYDMVFYRAVTAILAAHKLGSWQFLAQLPYRAVSLVTLWRLLWVMHQNCDQDGIHTGTNQAEQSTLTHAQIITLSAEQCQEKLQDVYLCELFQHKLMTMPVSEATFLLTTFSNMAQCREITDLLFIRAVTKEIYSIAYIDSHTRELCSKQGRELLTAISLTHPFVLSDLLQITMTTINNIGVVAIYLYKELPLHLWKPTSADLLILKEWLLTKEISSLESQLARLIVEKMNWGYNEKATGLFLDQSAHQEMALLLVDVYTTHLTGRNVGNLVTEGIKHVASMMSFQETDDQQLANWAWEVAQKLSLHLSMLPMPVTGLPLQHTVEWSDAPHLHEDVLLQPVAGAVDKGFALATYLGLMMSNYSHNRADFSSEGVKLLGSIVVKHHYLPTIKVLYHVVPMFYNAEYYLTGNVTFLQVVKLLLQADAQKRGMFFSVFPGPVTKLLTGAILSCIEKAREPGDAGVTEVSLLWLRVLTKLDNWNTDREVVYVLDKIFEALSRIPKAWDRALEYIKELFKALVTKDTDPTLLTSLSSFFGSGKALPSFLEAQQWPEFPWFVYVVLLVEGSYEEVDSQLWPQLQEWLFQHQDSTVDVALQAVCNKLKFCMSRSPGRLSICRWISQAVSTDFSHPILPLLWQNFFVLYLGRMNCEPGLPERGSVGEKFFQSSANISIMKKMKRRLDETVNHFQEKALELQSGGNREGGQNDPDSSSCDEPLLPEGSEEYRVFCLHLVKFYQTLKNWLDEPRLHDPTLYLPALPPQYDPERLLSVFQRQKKPWLEMVRFEAVEEELLDHIKGWTSLCSKEVLQGNPGSPLHQRCGSADGGVSIVQSLSRSVEPEAPPALITPRAPIPDIQPTLLCDQQSLIFALRGDFSILVDFAKVYCSRVAKNVGLDCTYVELLPRLYTNETTETAASAVCRSSFNPTHRCKGPAVISCRYEAAKRNDIISRKIEENRAEYNQIFIESMLPPPQNVCSAAVHVENIITSLILLLQNKSKRQNALDVGTALFYNVATFVSEDTKYYPPTCQFFSSCIEILGQEFIRNNPSQSQPLLQAILQNPTLVGLLSPNFSPSASPDLFVTMYQDMIPVSRNQGPDVAVTLLTKFEIEQWLKDKPAMSQREALLEVIGAALCQCGKEPSPEMDAVFQVHRVHLRHVISYQFPDHYGSLLKLILKGSASEQLSPYIWKDVLVLLGCDEEVSVKKNKPPSNLATELSTDNMKETLDWMSTHFMGLRVSNNESANFGLYPKWADYVPYVARFLNFLINKNIVAVAMKASSAVSESEGYVHSLWLAITDVFAPWIQPLDHGDQCLSPWIQSDNETAGNMVDAWVGTVETLLLQFEGMIPTFSKNALNLMWCYYVQKLGRKEVPKHVVTVIHSHLTELPWQKFFPDIQVVESMLELSTKKDHHACSLELLGHVFCRLDWSQITDFYTRCEIAEIRLRLYVCFYSLLVRLSQHEDTINNTSLPDILSHAESYDWNNVDGASYQETISWFQDNCDPKCVLAERGSQQALVLRLLKVASGFILVPNAAFHPETPVKRCAYVRCLVTLVCKCSHLKEINPDTFHLLITNLLTEVEGIVGTIPDPAAQHQESVSLCLEILGVFNHCNPQGASLKILSSTVLDWVAASPTSPVLLPLLSAACKGLASVSHMVTVVEACMDSYFTIDVSSSEGAGWPSLLAMLQVPELSRDQFIQEALIHGSFLLLFAYTLQQLPLSQTIDDEMACLARIVFWTSKAKPVNSNENKMLLWWDKMLELSFRQLTFGGNERKMVEKLKKFTTALVSLGEDKAHTGLLGAIGLGKKSQLSLRFRVMANCLATHLSAQVLSDGSLRKEPNTPGHISEAFSPKSPTKPSPGHRSTSQHTIRCWQHLEALKSNKQYTEFKDQLQYASEFIYNPAHSLIDSQQLFSSLLNNLFPDLHYLALIISKPQVS